MEIYYSVGNLEKKVVLKKELPEEFMSYLSLILKTGIKLPAVSETTGIKYTRLRNIKSRDGKGSNSELLIKLLSSYHYLLFPNEPAEEEEVLKPIVIEAIRDIVGEELSDKIARVEKENLEFYRILMRQQAKIDAMERRMRDKEK